jgi:hypothetical protein
MAADIRTGPGVPTPGQLVTPPSEAPPLSTAQALDYTSLKDNVPIAKSITDMGFSRGPLRSGPPDKRFPLGSGTSTGVYTSQPPRVSYMGKDIALTEGMGKLSSYYPALAALALKHR